VDNINPKISFGKSGFCFRNGVMLIFSRYDLPIVAGENNLFSSLSKQNILNLEHFHFFRVWI